MRLEAGFWDEVTSLWETGELPKDFWAKSAWIYRADIHRLDQERFSIASFYRLNQDRSGTMPYQRPDRFWLAQQQWVKWGLEKMRRGEQSEHVCISTRAAWEEAKMCRDTRYVQPEGLPAAYGKEVTLRQLEDELPPEWQVSIRTGRADVQGASGTQLVAPLHWWRRWRPLVERHTRSVPPV